MTVQITLRTGRTFSIEPEETLLDGALRAGLFLDHSCRTGRCGSCKVPVVEGQTGIKLEETGLTAQDAADGMILSCARTAISDVRLDVEDLGFSLPAAKLTPAKIDQVHRLSTDLVRLQLRLPPSNALRYLAGQYVDIGLPDGLKRSYSMASAPPGDKPAIRLDFYIRLNSSGAMSDFLTHKAQPGQLLRLHGPYGTFVLRQELTRRLLLLATGTGIAPIKALLEQLSQSEGGQATEVQVIWGNRRAADFFLDAQDLLPKGRTNYSLIRTLSGDDAEWTEARGRLLAHLPTDAATLLETTVYACGSADMIADARQRLEASGLPAARFHSDSFVVSS